LNILCLWLPGSFVLWFSSIPPSVSSLLAGSLFSYSWLWGAQGLGTWI
jgi:hypothetical protein